MLRPADCSHLLCSQESAGEKLGSLFVFFTATLLKVVSVTLRSFLHRSRIWRRSQEVRIYLSQDTHADGEWAGGWGPTGPPWVSLTSLPQGACKWRGGIFDGNRGVWGSSSLIFIRALSSQGKGGFLPFFSLIRSVTGISAGWILLCIILS